MNATLQFVLQYGYWVLFANVLAEQLGLPIPAAPALLAMGALAGLGNFSFARALAVAWVGCVMADFAWYYMGRTQGQSILNLMCKLSLEPDFCVRRTKGLFGRYGDKGLLVAKFLPGFSTVAPPMAGLTRMPPGRFLLLDGIGSLLWTGSFMAAGFLLRTQLEEAAQALAHFGTSIGVLVGLGVAAWGAMLWRQRRKKLDSLREARVTPEEVMDLMKSGHPLVFLDLRGQKDVEAHPLRLPNAIHFTLDELETRHEEIPRDREIVLYCS